MNRGYEQRCVVSVAFFLIAPLAHADLGLNPLQKADMVGRDLSSAGLGSIGHVGLWDGQNVIEVLDAAPVIQANNLNNFKSRSRFWGTSFYPQLLLRPNVVVCNNMVTCDRRISFTPEYGLMYVAAMWRAVGARYTTTVESVLPKPGYYVPPSPFAPLGTPSTYVRPTAGVFRCDTFVREVLRTGGTVPDAVFPGVQLPYTMFKAFTERGDVKIRTPRTPTGPITSLRTDGR